MVSNLKFGFYQLSGWQLEKGIGTGTIRKKEIFQFCSFLIYVTIYPFVLIIPVLLCFHFQFAPLTGNAKFVNFISFY